MSGIFGELVIEKESRESGERSKKLLQLAEICKKRQQDGWNVRLVRAYGGYEGRIERLFTESGSLAPLVNAGGVQ